MFSISLIFYRYSGVILSMFISLWRVVHSLSSESFHKLELKFTFHDLALHFNPLWSLNKRKVNPVCLRQEVDQGWSHKKINDSLQVHNQHDVTQMNQN